MVCLGYFEIVMVCVHLCSLSLEGCCHGVSGLCLRLSWYVFLCVVKLVVFFQWCIYSTMFFFF